MAQLTVELKKGAKYLKEIKDKLERNLSFELPGAIIQSEGRELLFTHKNWLIESKGTYALKAADKEEPKLELELSVRKSENMVIYYVIAGVIGIPIMFIGAIILPAILYAYSNNELQNSEVKYKNTMLNALKRALPDEVELIK